MTNRLLTFALIILITCLIACGGSPSTSRSSIIATPNVVSGSPTPAATTMNVAPGAAPPASSGIPNNAKVFEQLQQAPDGWSACSDCAGGAVTSSFWSAANQSSPSMSGSSRLFTIDGGPWADALWIHKLGPDNNATHFLWDFYVYFDSDSAANVWSAEYDFWIARGGFKHMVGSQCVFGENHWDIWDSPSYKWVNTGIPCPRFSPDTWHHIAWDVERISDTQYRYNTLWVDDQVIPVGGRVFDAEVTDWNDEMGVQWQLDQNGNGDPVKEWVDKVKLTIW